MTNFARGTLTASSYNGGQLDTVSAAAASQTISFSLDALGNATSKTVNQSTVNRAFNAQNQESSSPSSPPPLYDHNGNEVKSEGQGTTYVYDAWNRLAAVLTSSGTVLAGYNYDALGRRILEWYPTIAFAGGTLNIYSYYSAAGQVLEDRWATSTPLSPSAIFQNVWSEAYVNAMVLRDQDYSNNTLYQRLYAQQDANWNTTAVTDVLGTVQERFAYDPYGNVTVLNAGGTATGAGSTTGWRYLFQGGRFDFATGWYRFGFRDYNSAEGRWAERDPLGQAADINVYRFVGNNPVGAVDPSGLEGEWHKDYGHYFGENGGRARGVGQGLWNIGAGIVDEFRPSTLARQTREIFTRDRSEDWAKAKELWNQPGDYLAGRWRAVSGGITNQLSTPVGQGEAFAYVATAVVTGKLAADYGPGVLRRIGPAAEADSLGASTAEFAPNNPLRNPFTGTQPPLPPGSNNFSDFGNRLMQWGRRNEAARSRMMSITPEELRGAGMTRDLALQWRDFYRNVAHTTPGNPSAAGRADLMDWIAGML